MRPSPLDPDTAELLLQGGGWGSGHYRLAGLLAAVVAPARHSELAREEAVLAAFRMAHRSPVPQLQRQTMIKSTVVKLLTVKVAAVCATIAGAGGVALAASNGAIPTPLHRAGPSASASPATERGHGGFGPSTRPSGKASKPPAPPGLYRLCHDYIGRNRDDRGKALDEPGFRDLVSKTGGKDPYTTDKFCDKLLHDQPSSSPSPRPSISRPDRTHPSGRPSELPTPHESR